MHSAHLRLDFPGAPIQTHGYTVLSAAYEAIHAFHGEVAEQQCVIVIGLQRGDHLLSGRHSAALVSGVSQHGGDDLQNGLVIVDNQDALVKGRSSRIYFPGQSSPAWQDCTHEWPICDVFRAKPAQKVRR